MLDNELITCGELNAGYLGRTVTVRTNEGPCTGLLVLVEHSAEMVSVATMTTPDEVAPGRTYTRITLHGWGARRFNPSTPVDVLSY